LGELRFVVLELRWRLILLKVERRRGAGVVVRWGISVLIVASRTRSVRFVARRDIFEQCANRQRDRPVAARRALIVGRKDMLHEIAERGHKNSDSHLEDHHHQQDKDKHKHLDQCILECPRQKLRHKGQEDVSGVGNQDIVQHSAG
jgi:hypothetical protein